MIETRTLEQTVKDAQAYYDANLKSELEPGHKGEFVVIDLASHRSTLGRTMEAAQEAMEALDPDGPLVCLRVGFDVTVDFSGRS